MFSSSWYSEVLDGLLENPGCIGFHLCVAYQRSKARRRGLLDEFEHKGFAIESLEIAHEGVQRA